MSKRMKLKDENDNTIEEINLVGDNPSVKKGIRNFIILLVSLIIAIGIGYILTRKFYG